MAGGRPKKYDPKFIKKGEDYLAECVDGYEKAKKGDAIRFKVHLPTLRGFALKLGVHRDTLHDWSKKYPEFSDTLTKIKAVQAQRLIDSGLAGDYNSTIAKLILSSNHGMVERKDTTSGGKSLQSLSDESVNKINDSITRYLDDNTGDNKKR